jgi:hypothetical protein
MTAEDLAAPVTHGDMDSIVRGIVRAVREKLDPLTSRVEALEARPVGVKYCGVWSSTATYAKDEAVTWAGSLWVALGKSTSMKPGDSPGSWQLAAKRGADGKSATT